MTEKKAKQETLPKEIDIDIQMVEETVTKDEVIKSFREYDRYDEEKYKGAEKVGLEEIFSDEEMTENYKDELRKEYVDMANSFNEKEEEFKNVKASYTSLLKRKSEDMQQHLDFLNRGIVNRVYECTKVMSYGTGDVLFVNSEGYIVKRRIMTDNEKQKQLF